ncbi:hypothetical protein BDW42DRAFT_98210 [Aspergillus taichungensis]|uniref:Uncharacterized protein n=1 Tax=Aspergillus taichungensis TaxID=482145 RepID=A0A2J5HVJ8_9EURO|nr:hypothetical protein BDW42DRAFT_98210 [Aspergillus taichungensis]
MIALCCGPEVSRHLFFLTLSPSSSFYSFTLLLFQSGSHPCVLDIDSDHTVNSVAKSYLSKFFKSLISPKLD